MALEVIWTAKAQTDFFNIANYLRNNWSVSSAQKFIDYLNLKIEAFFYAFIRTHNLEGNLPDV